MNLAILTQSALVKIHYMGLAPPQLTLLENVWAVSV